MIIIKDKTRKVVIAVEVVRELKALLLLASSERHLNGRQRALMKRCARNLERGLNDKGSSSVKISLSTIANLLKCLTLVFDRRHAIRRLAESWFGWFFR